MNDFRPDEFRTDDPRYVGVERALNEFRAGRPVIIRGEEPERVVVPVDRLDADRLTAFLGLSAPDLPQLLSKRNHREVICRVCPPGCVCSA